MSRLLPGSRADLETQKARHVALLPGGTRAIPASDSRTNFDCTGYRWTRLVGPPILATSPSRPTASTSRNSRKRRRRKPGGQLNGPDWDWGGGAESEAPTQDSIVTVSDARPTPPRRDLPLPGQGMAAAPLLPAPPGIPHAGGPKVPKGMQIFKKLRCPGLRP